MADDNFSITITNKANNAEISVLKTASANDWRIPSDGLDGFGSMPFSTSQADSAVGQGGFILGAHNSIRQLTIKLEAPGTSAKRDEACKVFTVGATVAITISYVRSATRTITGVVTGCKVNEGNIYEPTTVTATIDCLDPVFTGTVSYLVATEYSATTSSLAYRWQFEPAGDSLAQLREVTTYFTTGNTEEVTLASQATLTLTINRFPTAGVYGLPDQTVLSWNMGDAAGSKVAANTSITCSVRWTDSIPNGVWSAAGKAKRYEVNSADLTTCKGISFNEISGGTTCSITLALALDRQIMPLGDVRTHGTAYYMPRWMGI